MNSLGKKRTFFLEILEKMQVNMRLTRIAQATGVALAFVYLLLGRAKNSKKDNNIKGLSHKIRSV
jgi:hypothetical protein